MTLGRPPAGSAIRDRVRRLPNVRIRTNVRCLGLVATPTRIAGVRAAIDGVEQELAGEVVVDASGRHSKLPEWLAELGFPAPPVDEVELETHYVTRVYSRGPQHLAGGIALVVVSDPETPLRYRPRLDERRWIIAIAGRGAPAAITPFVEFSPEGPNDRDLSDAQPLGPPPCAFRHSPRYERA